MNSAFGVWLLLQEGRGDRIGDLARDFRYVGVGAVTVDEVTRHMQGARASEMAMNALDAAVLEWMRS